MKSLGQKDLQSQRLKGESGFSLIELITVAALLLILSSTAIVSYLGYKNSSYDTWVKSELSRISGFLHMARAADGGFHQYLYAIGYRPALPIRGNAGFPAGYSNPSSFSICCADYPDRKTGSPAANTPAKEFSAYKYLPWPHAPGGNPPHHSGWDSWRATHSAASIYGGWIKGSALNSFAAISMQSQFQANGLVSGGDCSYGPGKAGKSTVSCDCSSFRIMGVSAYKNLSAQISASDAINSHGGKIWALDERGGLCFADKSSTSKKLNKR